MTIAKIQSILLILFSLAYLYSCDNDESVEKPSPSFIWKKIGLDGLIVNRLELYENNLYAISNDGIYQMNVNSSNEFLPIGLQGKKIVDIVAISEQHLLASYDKEMGNTEIYESMDGGTTWSIKDTNFGDQNFPELITDFSWDEDNEILYATGYGVLAKSSNKGTSWEIVWGEWGTLATGMMIGINPKINKDIWFGGQGSIENGYLIHLQNDLIQNEWSDLVPNPTAVEEIFFDQNTPQNIYVGWEGELNKTSDYGTTWETLINRHEEAHFFNGIGVSETNSNLLFTGKWIKGPKNQPLTLYYSKNGGANWEEETYPDEENGGILDIKLISTESKERIFVALDEGGVYEVIINTSKL